MRQREIIVRLIVDEEIEDWGDGDVTSFYELRDFEFVSSDIPEENLPGIGEHWAQNDRYYETVQNLVGIFDDVA